MLKILIKSEDKKFKLKETLNRDCNLRKIEIFPADAPGDRRYVLIHQESEAKDPEEYWVVEVVEADSFDFDDKDYDAWQRVDVFPGNQVRLHPHSDFVLLAKQVE